MADEILNAALAGLLHDIGKFAQRAGVLEGTHAEIGARLIAQWQGWLLRSAQGVLDDVIAHHTARGQAQKRLEKIIELADRLAAGERLAKEPSQSDPAQTPLAPILRQVRLTTEETGEARSYGLKATATDREVLFPQPQPEGVNREGYARLWQDFVKDLAVLEKSGPVDDALRLTTLLALLRKYLWCVPAATPSPGEDDRVLPDVSLYDHLKVTAAIAICLEAGLTDDALSDLYREGEKWNSPAAVMVRGDLSGIQSFIYRITRPEAEGEFEHVAKRLRGRSFYLGLLGDVAADYLIRTLGLSAANVLFVGGGRFDLLIPAGDAAAQALNEARAKLDDWLLKEFTGDLGLQIATADVRPADMRDMRRVYAELDMQLEVGKQRKWERYLLKGEFHISTADKYHACQVCHTTPLSDPGICDKCKFHNELGRKLPYTTHLAFAYGETPLKHGEPLPDFQDVLGVRVALLDADEARTLMAELKRSGEARPALMLQRLNDSDFLREDAPAEVGMSFRFLANSAPIARQNLKALGIEAVGKDDVLHFEAIAHLSTGAERLGVLKADVDRLGMIFGEGLSNETDQPTIARLSALSNAMDAFFAGWLNELCQDVSREWEAEQAKLDAEKRHEWAGRTDGLFYVMYSGGDDLFIVGPWDAMLTLAEHLRAGWAEYVCFNPNVTLSAGFMPVKPRYPVQRFAHEVDDALDAAKSAGRNRISLFGQTVSWSKDEPRFSELMALAYDLRDNVEKGDVPRTLVHDLGRLERQHRERSNGGRQLKPMWTPRLYYTLARRVKKEVREQLAPRLFRALSDISIPVSYVSLATRKE